MSKIRLGIIGARRGLSFFKSCKKHEELNIEVVAICDNFVKRLNSVKEEYDIKVFEDFDEMLKLDIDAVMLANYFHQHAPLAIKALRAGKHVLSETTTAGTLKECVELCEAVEETGNIYMLAENYPFTKMGLAMKKEYDNNIVGEAIYGEGEYIHPINVEKFNEISIGVNHWRNWAPSTYYCTHALAPLMFFTGTYPVSINALSIVKDELLKGTAKRCDPSSVILCRMNNGAVFRLYGWNSPGHGIWYRVHGTKGVVEAPRQYDGGYFGNGMLQISVDPWKQEENLSDTYSYMPKWPEKYKNAGTSGHGGGDYVVLSVFKDAIKEGKSPEFFDVYKGAAMSAVGIIGWKSALENGIPMEIPDFRDKASRDKVRDDDISPFPDDYDKPKIQCSINKIEPSEEDLKNAKVTWDKITGKK